MIHLYTLYRFRNIVQIYEIFKTIKNHNYFNKFTISSIFSYSCFMWPWKYVKPHEMLKSYAMSINSYWILLKLFNIFKP